ncbi:PepSY domain-containing protein [Methylobacterium sp. EM32]|uniref:PepSY domain-containing protein n=1 Tax=Methylobacterium sp. EM32 TaxID=3163481 RepID=UPI0033A891F9
MRFVIINPSPETTMNRSLALALVASLAFSGAALAKDQPGADWMTKADLKKHMESEGYNAIVVGADDGHWEGEAVKDGRIVEFHADAKTGRITKSAPKTEN